MSLPVVAASGNTCRLCGDSIVCGDVHTFCADEDATIRARGASFRYDSGYDWDRADAVIDQRADAAFEAGQSGPHDGEAYEGRIGVLS